MEYFNNEFIEQIPEDKFSGALIICRELISFIRDHDNSQIYSEEYYFIFVRFYAVLSAYLEAKGLDADYRLPDLSPDKQHSCEMLINIAHEFANAFEHRQSLEDVDDLKEKLSHRFNSRFSYKFSDGDVDRIQTLLNELRDFIVSHEHFEEEHRQRLLKRLEKLQAELHKQMSDIDRFWGLVGDAGVVLGKFGKDAKPFVDRIKELAEIVWNTQKRAEELPSNSPSPFLEHDNED